MEGLSKKDREIIRQICEGAPDLEVCRQFGLLPTQLQQVLDRASKRADQLEPTDNAAVMYERALRKRAENAANSLEARFHALLDAAPEAILVVNALTGMIHRVNENAALLFGYPAAELVGRSVEDLVPLRLRGIHPAYRIGFIASVRKREMGYHPPIFAVRKDGSEVEVAIALTASTADEEVMVVCTEFARWSAVEKAARQSSQRT
ncbi:PAS domain S-box protein [Fimbriimonas ginsengisoli]|uniref:Putative Two-component hybrid sensor and regulator n=1 Tax=Fimbriimonas ginsengisoli Gsoil 348 TaxID=661478 RepID=A0A068NT66_FIMGI|nr:PAS domain-containing protein [Fimbriimonas ginsengisoli]AIE86601.1 putative Two-component hybrid sensor and regulator [Fimbriimonas ginsengisoli Gsoil 348]